MRAITQELNKAMFKDLMYYLDTDSQTPVAHAKGVITGVIGTIMALQTQPSFEEACGLVRPFLPKRLLLEAIPEVWRLELLK